MNQTMFDYHHNAALRLLAFLFVLMDLVEFRREALQATDRTDRVLKALARPVITSRACHRRIAPILKAVEAAARRLIIWLATTMPVPRLRMRTEGQVPSSETSEEIPPPLTVPGDCKSPDRSDSDSPGDEHSIHHPPRFRLIDPVRYNIIWRDADEPAPDFDRSCFEFDPTSGFVEVSGYQLMLRIAALSAAFDDLPAQAARFNRWRARCNAGLTTRKYPFKPGDPPGAPRPRLPKSRHREEHHLVLDVHRFAWFAYQETRDTS